MSRLHRFWFLLALLLPLQLTWASASAYCAHESNPGHATHIGHHGHLHQADPQKAAAGQGLLDNDCGACHASCALPLPAPDGATLAPDLTPRRAAAPPHHYLSAQPRAPDRPQWPRLA
ncbi:cobalt-zinc-cadmium resistance protein [Variovorax sp. M-6]|uniref:cobalt-zinc-cadmium resistance protein n=1 Tax=Variovorax sp. M-6 TaxID=3233041 RepID=UPI003F9AD17B